MDHRPGGRLPVEKLTEGAPAGGALLSLRPVEGEDEAFLRALYATARPDVPAVMGWPETERAAFLEGQFRAQLASYRAQFPASDHCKVCLAGQPVGRLWVDRSPSRILIVDISLVPEHRRAGIGTTLMQGLIDEARDSGVPVRLSVDSDNPRALALYRRLGFRAVGGDQMRVRMELQPPASPATSR